MSNDIPNPLPYDLPSNPDKRHSAALTDGPDRAAARGMLKAIGFDDKDLARPLIGVATTWTETMPCNYNQRRLAEHVKAGIRAAGGTPMEFSTISVSDGTSMGTEGMKASLISREVIADSIELCVRGHMLDGVVCLVGCDKTIPGAIIALGRLDRPGVILYNGTIYPGVYKGKRDATIVTIFEAIGAYRAGNMKAEELYEIESVSCPGAGACGGQYTANTMSMVLEILGLSPAGLNGIPAEHPDKDKAAERCGEIVMDLIRRDVRPKEFVTRDSIDNAIACVAATGGSTNAVLHLLAIAHEYGLPLGIDDFGKIADRTPIVGDLVPGGRFTAADLFEAGGLSLVTRELLKKGLIDGSTANVDGGTIASAAAATVETEGQQVVVPIEAPLKETGGLDDPARDAGARRLRHQAGRPRAPLPQGSGPSLRQRERLLRGRPRPEDRQGRRDRDPLRGTGRRPGHAGDAVGDGGALRRGHGRARRPAHRRPVLRRHPRVDDRPRGAGGGAGRPDRPGRGRRRDRHRRRSPRPGPQRSCGRPR